MSRPFLSVVVPAFNEGQHIDDCISRLRGALDGFGIGWEIVVSDDGSGDATADAVRAWAVREPRVRLVTGPHLGKGGAVRRGLLAAAGEWRFIADADLSMPPAQIADFLELIRRDPAADLVIGSREAPGARRIGEPPLRRVIGRLFNWAVRLVAVPGLRDTQCGFKLLSARAAETLAPRMRVDGFAFDVELLLLARLAGFTVREVGITWHCRQDSRVTIGRGAAAFADVAAIRWRAWQHGLGDDGLDPAPPARLGPLTVTAWAYVMGAVFAAAFGYDLWRMPIQVYDAVGEILDSQRWDSALHAFVDSLSNPGYLRPLRLAQIKLLFDLSGGHYWLAYRGFHVLLLSAALLLFVRALRVRTTADLAAAAVALTVFTGLHTFRGGVQEAFPVNHFLEMVVFCLAALNLAQSRGGAVVDLAAVALFVVAALILESGLLVLVVLVAARLAGCRGVSGRGLAGVGLCVAGYAYLRFVHLAVGVPGLTERSSGFLFDVLDPPELEQRFGQWPLPFYAYNVLASMMSVLFSEPQSGTFVVTRAYLEGTLYPRYVIAVAVSLVTTAAIVWTGWRYLRGRARPDGHGHLLLVFAAILLGNAVLSFAYTKDEIVGPAGAFYGLASYAALRHWLAAAQRVRPAAAAALVLLLCVCGSGWAVRSLGVHNILMWQAFKQRNDWARLPGLWQRNGEWPTDPRRAELLGVLRRQALEARVGNQPVASWAERVWGD